MSTTIFTSKVHDDWEFNDYEGYSTANIELEVGYYGYAGCDHTITLSKEDLEGMLELFVNKDNEAPFPNGNDYILSESGRPNGVF